MSFWPNIRDLSRIRLDLNLLRNQFVLTRCSKLGCNGVWADLKGHPPKNHLSSFWQSFWNFCKCAVPPGSKGTCNTLFQPETGETNLTCVPLFSFACGGRVLVVPRGVSDTCHVSQVSPWVTTSPPPSSAPCGSHRYVGDNINIWESVTNGIGHWQGIWPEARNTWNVWPRQIRKLRVFWRVTLEHIGATSNCLCHELCFHDPIMTSRDPLVATLKSTRGTRYGWYSTLEDNEKNFLWWERWLYDEVGEVSNEKRSKHELVALSILNQVSRRGTCSAASLTEQF